jgi:catechol 2,3-dioxygenase-like lactoylglutathione lyase family enzyme
MNLKLYRIIFPVPDIDHAAKFYSDILGQQGNRVSPGRHYFNLGGTILALYDPGADGDDVHQKWSFHDNQYIYISTDMLEVTHQRCQLSHCRHVDTTIQTMPWGERLFYAHDPFGNPICFVDSSTVFTGESE